MALVGVSAWLGVSSHDEMATALRRTRRFVGSSSCLRRVKVLDNEEVSFLGSTLLERNETSWTRCAGASLIIRLARDGARRA